MKRRLIAALLAVAALAALPALALAGGQGSRANSQTYQDATGEDPAAPDISTIAVSNDDAGTITFRITIANRPALTPDMLLLLFLDTTPGQGDADSLGADYAFQALAEGVGLFRWNGTDYVSTPQSTLTWNYTAGVATFAIRATELGNTKQVNFALIAVSGITTTATGDLDLTNAHRDLAPSGLLGSAYSYEVKTTFTLRPAGFSTNPARPQAGSTFSAAIAATRSDTASLVRAGTVRCVAKIGNTALRVASSRVRNGVAACVWRVPARSAGKTIRGTITLVVDGATVARTFTSRVA